MKTVNLFFTALLSLLIAFTFSGCGGGGGSSGSGSSDGRLILSVADAPVDNATSVVVQFTGVEIKPQDGGTLNFDFDMPKQIDLLNLQGGGSEMILDEILPAGHYNWIRLKVDAECDVLDSYIVIDGLMYSLHIPSGSQNGLKLVSGFDVPAGGIADFTIDFDLRKSVNFPEGQGQCSGNYKLKPALRIVDNTRIGSLSGTVDPSLIDQNCSPAVYVFVGHDVIPDDIDGIDPEPVTTALVTLDPATGNYVYCVDFLNAGNYTVALTCQAADDDPATDDPITFTGPANVTVIEGQEIIHNF